MRSSAAAAALVLLAAAGAAGKETPPDSFLPQARRTLEQYGLPATGPGAAGWLREWHADTARREAVARWIRRLGDEDFADREAAAKALAQLPLAPLDALAAAADGDDPEIRWRAKAVLARSEGKTGQILRAVFCVIAAEPPAGAVGPLLATAPMCRQPFLRDALWRALRAAAQRDDLPRLEQALAGPLPETRVAAVVGMVPLVGKGNAARFHPLLDDRDDRVALQAASALADWGDRAALAALVRLLEAGELEVRGESIEILRGLTGRNHAYAPYEPAEKRTAAAAAWRGWVESEGAAAPLHFPVVRRRSARGDLHGHTLVSLGSRGAVWELDPAGKVVWQYAINSWSAEKLLNGNVLIASLDASKVVEVDAGGNVVWSYEVIGALKAKPLHSGNVLVADFRGRRVVEINRQRAIVWQHATPDGAECFDAERLPNGNTMYGCPNVLREITPEGKTVREWKIEGRLNGFHAQPNGNVVVANYGQNRVYELGPDGRVVWQFDEPEPCDAFVLPDGRMLVSTASRIIEVDPDRKTVRQIAEAQYGSARQ
jgi:hypothetical protein